MIAYTAWQYKCVRFSCGRIFFYQKTWNNVKQESDVSQKPWGRALGHPQTLYRDIYYGSNNVETKKGHKYTI